MQKHNIVAISGRLQSGKTELAKIFEKHGYERIYFALPLKKLVSELTSVPFDKLNDLKQVEKEYKFGEHDFKFLSDETNINLDFVRSKMKDKVFSTIREILQYVGTDIIREYNPNWHVSKIREMISPNKKYVIDDMRFFNEKNLVDELNGDSWFVIRPYHFKNISHHISEETLKAEHFGYNVVINDKTLDWFTEKSEEYVSLYNKNMKKRSMSKFLLHFFNKNKLFDKNSPFNYMLFNKENYLNQLIRFGPIISDCTDNGCEINMTDNLFEISRNGHKDRWYRDIISPIIIEEFKKFA